MAKYSINRLTDEEMNEFLTQHPKATPPDGFWQLMDGDIRMGSYKTQEAAKEALDELKRDDRIIDRFEEWADEIATEFRTLPSEVETIIRGHLQ